MISTLLKVYSQTPSGLDINCFDHFFSRTITLKSTCPVLGCACPNINPSYYSLFQIWICWHDCNQLNVMSTSEQGGRMSEIEINIDILPILASFYACQMADRDIWDGHVVWIHGLGSWDGLKRWAHWLGYSDKKIKVHESHYEFS